MLKPYYQDDAVTLFCGDAREIVPQLGHFDMLLTDPPYGECNRADSGLRNLDKGVADIVTGGEIDCIMDVTADSYYVWCGTEQVSVIRNRFVGNLLSTRLCIWEKTNPSPMNGQYIWLSGIECCVYAKRAKATFNEFCKNTVFRGPTETETAHPTEKPLWLFKKLICASTNVGHTILDMFAGSGTTGRAAKDLGRKCTLIEREERYCEIAAKRMAQEVLPLEYN